MMKLSQYLVLTLVVLLAGGCQSTGSSPAESIEGSWTSDIGGFPLTVKYAGGLVRVEGHADVPYKIEKNDLVIAGVTRIVSFPTHNEMIQTDPLTNSDFKFIRVN